MAGRQRFTVGARGAGAPEWVFRVFPFLLLALAIATRIVALGRYITPDEPTWVYRSILFREAVLNANWADTLVAGHPGVITTWLGAIGLSVQMFISPELRDAYDWLTTMAFLTPDNVEAFKRLALLLSGGRVAVVLVNSLGILAVYWLAQRVWGRSVAMIAGLLLAFDPFLAGLSGLLHVDGLSATFITISLLATAVGLQREEINGRSLKWPALAGSMGALAVLCKSPMLLVLPVTGLAYLWHLARHRDQPARARLTALLWAALIWGAAFLVTVAILFPAAWASPTSVLATIGGSAGRHLDEALRQTFFMGEAAFVHGPLFYPVVLLWRLSPVIWLLLIPIVALVLGRKRGELLNGIGLAPVLFLVVWATTFVVAISPAAKKFDRYILPAVPALLLVAAVVWVAGAERRPRLSRWVIPLVVAGQMAYWAAYAAYPLLAYNPLVGGPYTAVRMLPVGWGEAISVSGAYLAHSTPDAPLQRAIAGIAPSLAPFFPGLTLVEGYDNSATADSVIITIGGRQLDPAGVAIQTYGLDLIRVEHFGGLDQAWIYRNPEPAPPVVPPELPDAVIFGDGMALIAFGEGVEDGVVNMAARWRRLGPTAAADRYTLRIAIMDAIGNVWTSLETDLLNEVYFFPPDWQRDETDSVRYSLELPPGIPPGKYQVLLSLVDTQTMSGLPVHSAGGGFQGVTYTAGEIEVTLPKTIVSATRLQIPVMSGATWLDGRLQLLGKGEMAAEALAGSRLLVDLFWHLPVDTLPGGMELAWTLRKEDGTAERNIHTEALSRYDTGLWRTGETIQEKYRLSLPPDLSPGHYTLAVEPMLADGQLTGGPHTLAELQINNIDRLYELPDNIPVPLDINWDPLSLRGLDPAELSARPGESPELTLYWQNNGNHGQVYSVFVHVVNSLGEIVTQADHWPGGLPTDILDSGQVISDRFPLALPVDLVPGEYQIRVGLYSPESGVRLPAGNGSDHFILPVSLTITEPE